MKFPGIFSGLTTVLTLALAALCGSPTCRATTYNWNQSTAAAYNITTNWTPNGVPGSADTAAVGNNVATNGSVLFNNASFAYGLTLLQLGQIGGGTGTFTMSAGALGLTNNSGTAAGIGNVTNGIGFFTNNGGSLTIQRNGTGETYYRDVFQMGPVAGGTGYFTLNSGTVTCLGGIEIGSGGIGTLTVNGGTLIDNGWFGLGRGGSGNGWGTFNLAGGTVFLLRNPNTDSGANGISFCQGGTNGTLNISGGTLYCYLFRLHTGPGSGTDWETINISGGNIYLGALGVFDASGGGTHNTSIKLSGGTFHTVDLASNTGGTLGTNTVLADGADWAWVSSLPATLATGPGPGTVTFAPEAGHTITLNAVFSGAGNLVVNGPGTLAMGAAHTYTGKTTVTQGTLAFVGNGHLVNSPSITVGAGAGVDASGTISNLTLSAGQTLTNSSSTAILSGPISAGPGTLSLLYTSGVPAFSIVSGGLALATNTVFNINNTGAQFGSGSYKLISAASGGFVSGVGLPPVTVTGGGVVGGQFVGLNVLSNELYLIVTNDRPPVVAQNVSFNLLAGSASQIAITNLAALAGWSDPDGDPVSFNSAGPTSADGTNITSDGTYIYYNGALVQDDSFTYTITDGKLTASGVVYLNLLNPTAVVPSETNHVISLDGNWRFYFEQLSNYWTGSVPNIGIVDSSQQFQRLNYVEGGGWTNIAVPSNWEMAGFSPATYFGPDNTSGLYRDWFQVPASWQGRQVYLYFDGVQTSAEIWVNGQPALVNEPSWGINNYHDSGWTGFQVNVTPFVNFGTSNLFAVRVVKQSPSVDLDTGDYFTLGGIFRSVKLYTVPQTNFADVQVETHLLPGNQARLDITADVTQGDASTPVIVTFNGVQTVTNAGNGKVTFSQIVNQPNLWSAEFPNLYPLTLQLKDPTGQAVTETVSNRIGIREITITNAVVYLNGVPVKFAGVCNHDSCATNGNAMDLNSWRTDLTLMKAANINAIRTTHYTFGSGFFDLCDEMGMYVANELPYCWVSSVGNTGMTPAFEQRAREVIRRDRNHPSVVVWAIGNENSAGSNLQDVANLVRSLDTTRPRLVSTFAGSQYNVELSDRHYPTPATMQSDGAAATVYPWIYMEQPNTWDVRLAADASMYDRWGLAQQRVWNVVEQYATICGTFPFEWSDRALTDPNSQASYNASGVQPLYFFPSGIHLLKMKGMVDGFRNVRPSVYEAQMIYSPIQVADPLTVGSGQVSFTVTNRYSFTDLSYLTMNWKLMRAGTVIASGITNESLPPWSTNIVQLTVPTNALAYADNLQVDFLHPDGRDIVAHKFALMPVPGLQLNTNLPPNLPIPSINLIVRKKVGDLPNWSKELLYPSSLASVVLTPPNATNLAQLQSLSATVMGGTNGAQTLGTISVTYSNNQFSYSLQWSGLTWEVHELGWAFQMPTNCDHFSWDRSARWTVYPSNKITRATGVATPDSTNADYSGMFMPNAFDFNSTKYDCNSAELAGAGGSGLRVEFDLSQRFHCKAGGASNGYVLYVNQQVSVPNDFTTQVVPDQIMTLSSGNNVSGSFHVGSVTNASTSASAVTSITGVKEAFSNSGPGGTNQLGLTFNANSNQAFSVWSSGDLVRWTWSGSVTELTPGHYQFFDPGSTNAPYRFYRFSSP